MQIGVDSFRADISDPATGLLSMRKQPIFFDTNNVARFNHSLMLEGSLKCWNARKPEL